MKQKLRRQPVYYLFWLLLFTWLHQHMFTRVRTFDSAKWLILEDVGAFAFYDRQRRLSTFSGYFDCGTVYHAINQYVKQEYGICIS